MASSPFQRLDSGKCRLLSGRKAWLKPSCVLGPQGMENKDAISVLEVLEVWGDRGQVCREAAALAEQSRGQERREEHCGRGCWRGWGRGWDGRAFGSYKWFGGESMRWVERLLALADGLPGSQGGLLASKPFLLELLAPRTQRRNFPRFLADSLLSGQPLPSLSYTLGGDFRVSR